MLYDLKGEHLALLEMRSHIGWYLKGIPGASPIKNQVNMSKSFDEVLDILKNFLLK
jgi:tRNA-dihydrouridine synthase